MTNRFISVFSTAIIANPQKMKDSINKIDVYYMNDTWNMILLDLNVYGPKKLTDIDMFY